MTTRTSVSPSGRFRLVLEPERDRVDDREWEYVRPTVYDAASKAVYVAPLRIASWFPLAAAWDASDRAWVASADSGTLVFQASPDGWKRAMWDPELSAATVWDAATGEEVAVVSGPPPPSIAHIAR